MGDSVWMPRRVYVGMDLSINHGGVVALLEDGSFLRTLAYCDKPKDASPPELVSLMPAEIVDKKRNPDWSKRNSDRFFWYTRWLNRVVLQAVEPGDEVHFALEDYAYNADQGAHQIGEVGGFARLRVSLLGGENRLRLHDPGSVKIFATGNGTAEKPDMLAAVEATYGIGFYDFKPQPKRTKKEPKNPPKEVVREDMVDAYVLARMVMLEDQVRRGVVRLSDCTERQIRIFNRTTKRYPTNLLDRPYAVGGPS